MKKIFYLLLFGCFVFQPVYTNAQLGNLKNKATKSVKESTKSNDSQESTKSNTSNSTATKEVDFTDLKEKKMEWNSTFERMERRWDFLSYSEYTATKSEYDKFYAEFSPAYKKNNSGKDHQDTYTQKLITTVDGYYTEKATPEQMAAVEKKVERSFDEKDWEVSPSARIEDIETAEKMINTIKGYLKDQDPELLEYETKLKAQKQKIIDYVTSGGPEKRNAAIQASLAEERTLHSVGMTDATVNATVVSKIDKTKYGTPVRTVITSKVWEIERDNYGNIKLKFVKVDIATKKADGTCYYVRGSVARLYEGGGKYGSQYLNIYYTEGQMNCNNVNK